MVKHYFLFLALIMSINFAHSQPTSDTFPEFSYYDIDGNLHVLSEYQAEGKIVIVDIFTTWCPFCIQSLAGLEEILELHGPEGDDTIVILKFERDPETDDEAEWAIENNVDGPIITGAESLIADEWNISYQPNFFVICPDGSFEFFQGNIGSNSDNLLDLADECDSGVSVSELNPQKHIEILSSLVSEQLTVLVKGASNQSVMILDVNGKIVDQLILKEGVNMVDVSNYPIGAYILVGQNQVNRIDLRFLKF